MRGKMTKMLFAAALAACALAPGAAFAADADGANGALTTGASDALGVAADAAAPASVSMYRLYNPNSGEHFYTSDHIESNDLTKQGWVFEGIGWKAPQSSASPVYRLYNSYGGEHHYTLSAQERDALVVAGWTDEGVGWYSADSDVDRVGLYRDYNPNEPANNHNYTIAMDEHAALADAGWVAEGGGWFGLAQDASYDDGWLCVGDDWRYYREGVPVNADWVIAIAPPPVIGAGGSAGVQRYWLDSKGACALGRLVDPANARDKAAGYLAYARAAGDIVCGKWDDGNGHIYVADGEGRLPEGSGWLITDAYDGELQRYWLDGNLHAVVTGMFEVDGNQYYGLGVVGYVARNLRFNHDGAWLQADNDGVISPDAVVANLVNGAQGLSSPSQYLIAVDIDDPCTVVLEGSEGNWSVKYVWECSTGAPETPTVTGVYSIGAKGYSFGEQWGYSCYYWTSFYGDYLFHTGQYYAGTFDVMDHRMNMRLSGGCVRLPDEYAIWIQENCPYGTTVYTTT